MTFNRVCLVLVGALVLASCVASSGKYSGSGGMTRSDISPEVYIYHYENGFTGPDAMGWAPELQYAWSRLGAAETCNIPFDEQKALTKLKAMNDIGDFAHKMNGIEFHHLHSREVPDFCTPERVAEINAFLVTL